MNGLQSIIETDILIIGAGPAGSAAAIQLRNAGFKTIIIDKSAYPRNAPGETLHPGIEPLLEQLGVLQNIRAMKPLRHEGIVSIENQQTRYVAYNDSLSWAGFNLMRKDLDSVLLDRAKNLGAGFVPKCQPKKIDINEQGDIEAVICQDAIYKPQFVIDATGRRGWLASQLGIPYQTYSSKLITYYGYTKKAIKGVSDHPCMYWDENGWTWAAKINDTLTAIVRLDTTTEKSTNLCNAIPLYQNITLEDKGAADVTWRVAEKTSEGNYFLVGDSAFVLDPASSKGVIKAIMTGIAAGHLIAEARHVSINEIHTHYNQWVRNWFEEDMSVLKNTYRDKGINISIFEKISDIDRPS